MDDLEKIENADISNVWNLFLVKAKKNYFFSAILPILLFWLSCWLSNVFNSVQPFMIFLVFFVAIYGIFWQRAVTGYLIEFAVKAGFSYQDYVGMDTVEGTIFNFGSARNIAKIVLGKYFGQDTRLFVFSTTVGSGKHKHTYMYSVLEITFDTLLPNILLNNRKNSISSTQWPLVFPDNEGKLSLGINFDKQFKLYVAKEYEIEAFQIFTPEIMQIFIDKSDDISAEFFKNKVYLYYPHQIIKKSQLVLVYSLAKEIILRLGPKFALMKNDVQEMAKYTKLT